MLVSFFLFFVETELIKQVFFLDTPLSLSFVLLGYATQRERGRYWQRSENKQFISFALCNNDDDIVVFEVFPVVLIKGVKIGNVEKYAVFATKKIKSVTVKTPEANATAYQLWYIQLISVDRKAIIWGESD